MISRFHGISVPGWAGPLPGGGIEGATPVLDAAVQAFAQYLHDRFKRDVVIRFNANRLSGGAWIVDPRHQDAGLGLCARLRDDGTLLYAVYIVAPFVAADAWGIESPGSAYAYYLCDTPDVARSILSQHLRPGTYIN